MNANTMKLLLALSAFAVASNAFAQESEKPVNVTVERLPAAVATRIQEKAALGQTALIQYLNRTRMLHQIRIESIVVAPAEPRVDTKAKVPEVQVAKGGSEKPR